jgi:hypothetical protein
MLPPIPQAYACLTPRYLAAMRMASVLLAALTCLGTTPVFACDGPDPVPVAARFADAKVVAIVRVMSVSVSPGQRPTVDGHAEVVETLKGAPGPRIAVRGFLPSVDCWLPIDAGREYVVFLPGSSGEYAAWFSMFGDTIPVAEMSQLLLKKWRANAAQTGRRRPGS